MENSILLFDAFIQSQIKIERTLLMYLQSVKNLVQIIDLTDAVRTRYGHNVVSFIR